MQLITNTNELPKPVGSAACSAVEKRALLADCRVWLGTFTKWDIQQRQAGPAEPHTAPGEQQEPRPQTPRREFTADVVTQLTTP